MNNNTLWSLLSKQKVEIPIIQRDYAQGRLGKEFLREKFLGSLIESLEKGKLLPLDFVYGTVERENIMWPLDGQQRLTTLWLLHWYIALRAGVLAYDDVRNTLCRFTYETRVSSRDFCKNLCLINPETYQSSNQDKIVDFIRNQTWYYTLYNQDSTVQGMLRMLSGTDILNSEKVDIKDGIEEYLYDYPKEKFNEFWGKLVSAECPITFVYKDMKDEDLPLSDDLYIKMNARGKQLSDFENFKADFVGYVPNPDKPDEHLITVEEAALVDNQWNDVFWAEAVKKQVYLTDEIYYKFLRRYMLNYFIVNTSLSIEKIQNSELYKDIYKGNINGYSSIHIYKDILGRDFIDCLKKFFNGWNRYGDKIHFAPTWTDTDNFAFIPEYIIEGCDESSIPTKYSVTSITQKQRVVFLAVTSYLEENDMFNENGFKDWICFVWNVVENSNLSTEESMISALRFVNSLRKHSGDILAFLASDKAVESKFAQRQVEEEKFKATLMMGDNKDEWKSQIRKAESSQVLKGNIGCLLRHATSDYVDDIECFKKKLINIEKYFDSTGLKADWQIPVTKTLIRLITDWNKIIGNKTYIFDTSLSSWKVRFFEKQEDSYLSYFHEVDSILNAENLNSLKYLPITDSSYSCDSENKIKQILSETDILNSNIVCHGSTWRIKEYWGAICFYKNYGHHAYVFDWKSPDITFRRNELLHTDGIEVCKGHKQANLQEVFWDWNIPFIYNRNYYRWDWNNIIYLTDDLHNNIQHDSSYMAQGNDNYYNINMKNFPDIDAEQYLDLLTKLAKKPSLYE